MPAASFGKTFSGQPPQTHASPRRAGWELFRDNAEIPETSDRLKGALAAHAAARLRELPRLPEWCAKHFYADAKANGWRSGTVNHWLLHRQPGIRCCQCKKTGCATGVRVILTA